MIKQFSSSMKVPSPAARGRGQAGRPLGRTGAGEGKSRDVPSSQPSPAFRGRRSRTVGSLVPFILLALIAVEQPAYAISSNAGTTNGNFLEIATDARGVAFGDSAVSMIQGADALRWNPAALGVLESKEVSGTHVQYYQGVTMENVAAAYPFENAGLAVNVFYLSAGSLDGRDVFRNQTGDFQFYDMVGTIGYGRKLMSRANGSMMDLSLGASLKLVREVIADQTFQNPALDLAALVTPIDDLNLGLTVRDLSSGSADFSREMIAGASYTLYKNFTGGVAANYSNDAPVSFSAGTEYRFPDAYNAAVRAGYQTHDPLDNSTDSQITWLRGSGVAGLTLGAGFEYPIPGSQTLKVGVDYAMAPFGALGIAHTITARFKW